MQLIKRKEYDNSEYQYHLDKILDYIIFIRKGK